MTKDNVYEWDTDPAGNTTIASIGIVGTSAVANFDNAFRESMAQIRTGMNNGNLVGSEYLTKSAGYTAVAADRGKTINCTAALTLALTAAATLGSGWVCTVKANGGNVTIDPNSSETINGAATYVVRDGSSADVVCDGTNFQIVRVATVDKKGADLASASTVDLSAATGNYVDITGTTTITSFGTVAAGLEYTLQFDGILTITYNGTSMILPGGADITTAAGDVAVFRSEGSGNWRCVDYTRNASRIVEDVIYSGEVSTTAEFTLTGLSAYRTINIRGRFRPNNDGVLLLLRTSSNNGSTYDDGASDYAYQLLRVTGEVASGTTDEDYLAIIVSPTTVGNASTEGIFFNLTLSEFNQALYMYAAGTVNMIDSSSGAMTATIGGRRNQATARDAFKLFFATGNIDVAHVTVTGVRG